MASELFFVFISSKRLLTVDLDILVILDVRMSPTLSQDTFRKWGEGEQYNQQSSRYILSCSTLPHESDL
ncbi:hypothetical protein Hjap01_04295 [Haloarcula japonica]